MSAACKLCGKTWPKETERMRAGKTCSKRCSSIKGYLSGNHKETGIELKLQKALDNLSITYETQVPVMGICVADVFVEPNIVLFADGSYWHGSPKKQYKDAEVTRKLEKNGFVVGRLSEAELMKEPGVVKKKLKEIYGKRPAEKKL